MKDKNDIGTQIMIQVLAVMSQYEIELFTSRGIDGKISAIKNSKTTQGGPCAYGYRISEDSKIVVDETEAAVIRRIFDMFLHGMRVRTIKEATELYSRQVKRAIKYSINDDDAFLHHIWP